MLLALGMTRWQEQMYRKVNIWYILSSTIPKPLAGIIGMDI